VKETKLYAKIRPYLQRWGEFDRVENAAGSGMADVFYNIDGKTGWIETKVSHGHSIFFEKFQPQWLGKHRRLGARIFVLVLDSDEAIRLYDAADVVKAPRSAQGKWVTVSMNDLGPPELIMPKPYRSWDLMCGILSS
jgi:hypothetical protein